MCLHILLCVYLYICVVGKYQPFQKEDRFAFKLTLNGWFLFNLLRQQWKILRQAQYRHRSTRYRMYVYVYMKIVIIYLYAKTIKNVNSLSTKCDIMLSFQSTKYAIFFKLVNNNKIRIDLDKDLKWQKNRAER